MADSTNVSTRRTMTSDELQIIHQTQRWKPANYRGAAADDTVDSFATDLTSRSAYTKPEARVEGVPSLQKLELSLMHLNMNKSRNVQDIWTNVSETIQNMPNIDPMLDIWSIMGNVYDHGKYCEFLMGLYKVEDGLVLDFKRMSGDGFVMDGFFNSVTRTIKETKEGLIESDGEEEKTIDFSELYSDDESDDGKESEDSHLTTYGFLQLSYDPNLVTSWIEKIKTRHVEDKNHMMGLMAHNAKHKKNLDIIVEKGGVALRNLMSNQLSESNSAALVRNTSALAKAVTSVKESKPHNYNAEFVGSCLNALGYWVPGNGRRNQKQASSTFEITESRETAKNLVHTIVNTLKVDVTKDEVATQIRDQLDSKDISNIVAYLKKQNDESESYPVLLDIFQMNTE